MYGNASTIVKTTGENTETFSITIVLHQESAMNQYLFNLVVDELTERLQDDVP